MDSLTDILTFTAYLLITWLANAAMIGLMYIILLVPVALPVTLLLGLIGRREPRTTHEADAFFTAVGRRAAASSKR